MSDFGSIRALRLGGVADKRNPFVPGANWFGILVYVDKNKAEQNSKFGTLDIVSRKKINTNCEQLRFYSKCYCSIMTTNDRAKSSTTII